MRTRIFTNNRPPPVAAASASAAAAMAVAVAISGCGKAPAIWTGALTISPPMRVADHVMWVDATRGLVFSLDPGATPPSVRVVSAGRGASFAAPSPTRQQLLVLTPGREATRLDQQPEAPRLTLLAPSGGAPTVVQAWPLPAPFDRIAVTDDGALGVAYFSDSPPDNPDYFRNPNELAIVDLTAPPSATNPTFRTIRSLGAAPLGVVFSPPLTIPPAPTGTPRTLAVVLSPSYLTFVDLAHLDRPEITVPLVAADSAVTVTPRQVIFDADGATAYVRADGSQDLFALALEPRAAADPKANDWLPHVNQPTAGRTASDMLLYHDAGRAFLLAAVDRGQLALIDAATSGFTFIDVGAPVDTLVPVPREHPTMAVAFSRASPQSVVHFLDLAQLDAKLGRNLSRRVLARPVHDLVPIPGDAQLLVLHDDARTVISILDLGARRTDTPILGHVPLASYDFVGSGTLAAVSPGLSRLGLLDLGTLNPTDLRLDTPPQRVLAVGSHLVVDHGLPEGMVTVLPAPAATRDDATVLWGFFLDGVLDKNLQD